MSRLRQGDPTVAIGTLLMAFLRNRSQQMGWANYVQEIRLLDRYRRS